MQRDSRTIFAAALVGGAVSALVTWCSLNYWKSSQFEKLRNSEITEYPADIKEELTSRVKSFFGDHGQKKLSESFVIVVGLGGVGSHCANMLVRSGVGRVRIIDFDQVTLSSLNRHAVADMHDVGTSKPIAMYNKLKAVVPWCDIDAVTQMFKAADAPHLLRGNPDLVVDCIDDINTKAELIAYCVKNNLPILTSMGAGGKADPTRLRVASLNDCINDPLASKIKWKLKKAHGVGSFDDVVCVFSNEKPIANLLPLSEEQRQAPQDYGSVDYFRLRVMPVLGTSPSMFGQAMASYVLCKIAGQMYEPEVCERMSKNLKHKIRQVLKTNENVRFKANIEGELDDEDIEFVVQQVWKSRCAVTGCRFGGHVILTLTRWDATKPPVMSNLVLMMQKEAQLLHERGQQAFDSLTVEKIQSRLDWAKIYLEEQEIQFSKGLKDGTHFFALDRNSSYGGSLFGGIGVSSCLSIIGGAVSAFAAGFLAGQYK